MANKYSIITIEPIYEYDPYKDKKVEVRPELYVVEEDAAFPFWLLLFSSLIAILSTQFINESIKSLLEISAFAGIILTLWVFFLIERRSEEFTTLKAAQNYMKYKEKNN